MRKIIIISILFLSGLSNLFSQSERDQKQRIVNQSQNFSNSIPRSREIEDKSRIINQPRQNYYSIPNPGFNSWSNPYYYNPRLFWWDPVWGYNYYDRWWMNDIYGYRIPMRTYVYSDGRRDTLKGRPTSMRFGLGYSTQNDVSAWATFGSKSFFIIEYTNMLSNDESVYYSNPEVNFYNAITPPPRGWGDKRLEDIKDGWSFYLGVGKRKKNTSGFIMIGFSENIKNYQFFDENYILSNNGKYSFKNYRKNMTTFKFGIIQDYKSWSFKSDFDPIRNVFNFGMGLNF